MPDFEPEKGTRVRVDIADETDPDHDAYHGRHGFVEEVLEDEADIATGDRRDGCLFRVRLEDGTAADFRWRDLRPPLK